MGAVIEHEGPDGNRILVGDSSTEVTLKTYQDVYHQITGRTERISKSYYKHILLNFTDLQQLHLKIGQLCDVHNVVARNEVITVFHTKDRKERFTSFERFTAYNSSSTSATVNIFVKYNFSIIPAGLNRAQEYSVGIELTSRVALIERLERDAPPHFDGALLPYIPRETVEVSVEYADYVIARGFLEALDEWVEGCEATIEAKWLKAAARLSRHFPRLVRLGLVIGVGSFALHSAPMYFAQPLNAVTVARFSIIYLTAGYCLSVIGWSIGESLRLAVEGYPTLSHININKGDEQLIRQFSTKQRKVVLRAIFSAAIAILLSIISTKLERFI